MPVILFAACILFAGNSGRAIAEFSKGEVTGFSSEMADRYARLETAKQQSLKEVTIPSLKNKPSDLFVLDIQPGCDHWINQLYANYFSIDKVCTDTISTK